MSTAYNLGRIEDYIEKADKTTKPAHGGPNLYKAEYVDLDGKVERTLLSAKDIPHAVEQMVYFGDVKHVDQVTMVRRIGAPEFREYFTGKPARPAAESAPKPAPEQQPLFSDDMLADVHAYLNRCTDVFRIGDRRGDSIESIAAEIEKVPVPDGVTAYVALVDKALLDR